MSKMKWKDLEGKMIKLVIPDQEPVERYREPIAQEDCWTYEVKLVFTDGTSATIEGYQHDEVGGIGLKDEPGSTDAKS